MLKFIYRNFGRNYCSLFVVLKRDDSLNFDEVICFLSQVNFLPVESL